MDTSLQSITGKNLPISIVDVGAASMGEGTDPYFSLLQYDNVSVIGFEPNKEACEEKNVNTPTTHSYFPYFIGLGDQRKFYECHNPLTSSLYKPNEYLLSCFSRLQLPVINVIDVNTVRLDDIGEIESADFLKIDVQGAELDVIKGGWNLLDTTLVVHTEVEFIPMYEGQALFGDIDVALREKGFLLHQFVKPFSRQMNPVEFDNNPFSPGSQIIYAEAAVYVRDFSKLDSVADDDLLKMALILFDVYGSTDMGCHILSVYDARNNTQYLNNYVKNLQ